MKNEMQLFMRKRADNDKLEAYGFKNENGVFCYRTRLLDGQFLMEVYIKDVEVQTRLLDIDSKCEYVLHTISGA